MSDPGPEVHPSEIARRGEIRRIGAERFGVAAATLASAYRADPLVAWSLAADTAVLGAEAHERYWRGVLWGLPAGSEVHATYGVEAVALWRPADHTAVPGGRAFELVALGVDPASRGRGLARRLAEVMFARADRLGAALVACLAADGTRDLTAIGGVVRVRSEPVADGGPTVVEYLREPAR
ncbi:MAG: hypothetical protein RIE08_01470 [Acidimicrobiales bacterium]